MAFAFGTTCKLPGIIGTMGTFMKTLMIENQRYVSSPFSSGAGVGFLTNKDSTQEQYLTLPGLL